MIINTTKNQHTLSKCTLSKCDFRYCDESVQPNGLIQTDWIEIHFSTKCSKCQITCPICCDYINNYSHVTSQLAYTTQFISTIYTKWSGYEISLMPYLHFLNNSQRGLCGFHSINDKDTPQFDSAHFDLWSIKSGVLKSKSSTSSSWNISITWQNIA